MVPLSSCRNIVTVAYLIVLGRRPVVGYAEGGSGVRTMGAPRRTKASAAIPLIALLLVGLVPQVAASEPGVATPPALASPSYAPGRLLVRFDPSLSANERNALLQQQRARSVARFGIVPGLELIAVDAAASVPHAVGRFSRLRGVMHAEPDYTVSLTDTSPPTPNDEFFEDQWALHNTGQDGGAPDADIDGPEAWDRAPAPAQPVVATIDTGVNHLHEDLEGRIWRNDAECDGTPGLDDDGNGYADDCHGIDTSLDPPWADIPFVRSDPLRPTGIDVDNDPLDDNGHGTHVAGTVAAVRDNEIGVAGVSSNAKVMACKALDGAGSGYVANAVKCLEYVKVMRERGVPIVATNNSWEIPFDAQAPPSGPYSLRQAISAHIDAGILFVAAAGNGGGDDTGDDNDAYPTYPASYDLDNVVSVAASDNRDELASFSNYGASSVHLAAPGEGILSTWAEPALVYHYASGTSMAAPHVTGVAALLYEQEPDRDWRAIRNLIFAGVDRKPNTAGRLALGGRLNAGRSTGCSGVVFTPLSSPATTVDDPALRVLNVNCAAPAAGPPSLTAVVEGRGTLEFRDDGVGWDRTAGDGIYAAIPNWSCPSGLATLVFPNGYRWSVATPPESAGSYRCTASTGGWRDITAHGVRMRFTDEDAPKAIAPGFAVKFGSGSFSSLLASENGFVALGSSPPDDFDLWAHTPLPNGAFTGLVAPLWADVCAPQTENEQDPCFAPATTTSDVYWGVVGAAPNRELVVEWRDLDFWDCRSDFDVTTRFQAVFSEATNKVLFNYADVEAVDAECPGLGRGGFGSIGVQLSQADATQLSFDRPTLHDNLSVAWTIP